MSQTDNGHKEKDALKSEKITGEEVSPAEGGTSAGGASGSVTQRLYERAKQIIPGGVQLLSKRPEQMAPGLWPAYYREARGCEVWDLDDRHYYDLSTNGIGACLLGFADEDVSDAVIDAVRRGSMCTLNPPEEVELAEQLCAIHPWAQQARFTRGGGEACAAAIRIARATTGRSVVAVCGYHGWHDWYLAANLGEAEALNGHLLPGLNPSGVPRELSGTVPTFGYNDREAFRSIVDQYGSRLACVIMEPCRYRDPEPGFLEFVRDEAHRCGALLIFDEITIGWRLNYGGAHLQLGVKPDLAVFAKALGNGHPIGAVIGTEQAMEGAHLSFISSTYWTESVGPAAALATLAKMKRSEVAAHVQRIGEKIKDSWSRNAFRHGLPVAVGDGYACLANFRFQDDQAEQLRTLFTQLMLERGFLAGTAVYPTLAHTDAIVSLYDEAVDEVFDVMANALREGKIEQSLRGPIAHSGFRRLL
ncbi:aminotransferase class III-fold pyridoxal phosphate-dependent enzyme [Paenibacillus eucommiae]|uniref:Glutamate-1-semialdehyde aminotransferase n=1 Tax=Paenibacillus eucommiae TaxID=1355755 RepID=A0ABS4IX06_9BACL|nr:aminotransferase class III-fold pyridoxal phosphate-dependent enzyme [Paenibacillus eucommiae]MBP1992127.1 glutamate-1-semialdehyde aminotransferase [Paenibacillus eucommiae]